MINEEIIGGLISALSRKQTLENAMMTFYNAGYSKEDIEDSAKEVYNQVGAQLMGVKGSLQDTLNQIATKAGVPVNKDKPAEEAKPSVEKLELQTTDKKPEEQASKEKPEEKSKPVPITYSPIDGNYKNTEDITHKIEEALKTFKPVNIPSRIEIINKNMESPPQKTIVQHVSDYSPPKPVSKTLTYTLIGILILLLIALGAVFIFKDELIDLFNKLGLA